MDDALWTLDELVEQVAAVLSDGYEGAPNGRVRGLPDRRAVRWYTTVGLVDRPATMRGRTALYGPRHLFQLVAIKRRQAAGRSLADIQRELAGAADTTLRDVARVPDVFVLPRRSEPLRLPDPPVRRRFWAAAPAPAPGSTPPPGSLPADAPASAPAAGAPSAPAAKPAGRPDPPAAPAGVPDADRASTQVSGADPGPAGGPDADAGTAVHGFGLPGGATLVLPAGSPAPGPADLAALRAAARPLVDELARRGLISTDPGRRDDTDRQTDRDQLGGTR